MKRFKWGICISTLMFSLFFSQTIFANERLQDDKVMEISAFNNTMNEVQDDAIFKMNEYREKMEKVIADAYNLTGKGSSLFTDISKSWAKSEIELLAYNGISVGTPEGKFKPKANISRAEFSVMLARAMNDDFKVDSLK